MRSCTRCQHGFPSQLPQTCHTQDAAALVTDSRYWVQAEQQLEGSGIELVKLNQGYAAESADWQELSAIRPKSYWQVSEKLYPRFNAGMVNTFSYRNFSFSFQLNGQYGNQIYNYTLRETLRGNNNNNLSIKVVDRWRSPESPGNGLADRTYTSNDVQIDRQ